LIYLSCRNASGACEKLIEKENKNGEMLDDFTDYISGILKRQTNLPILRFISLRIKFILF
jgi:hypothetical protein